MPAKKGHALSLHDFISKTPGALPIAASLPTHHGEVSKVEGPDLAPRFGELDLGSSYHGRHAHTYHSPYELYYMHTPSSPSIYECGYTENEYGFGPLGAPKAPPPPPRKSTHSAGASKELQQQEGSAAPNAGQCQQKEEQEPLVPGTVKLLRKPAAPEASVPAEAHDTPHREAADHAAEMHRASELDRADHAEAAAIADAAEAQSEAAAAAAAAAQPLVEPLVGKPQQQEQQQQRQEAAVVKNNFAERMAARALERMAARSALHSQSSPLPHPSPSAPTPVPAATTAATTVSAAVSMSEKPQQQLLQEALKERAEQQPAVPQPQPQPQPQQRPKLNLLPRSKPLDVNQPPERVGSAAIFGSGRPREEKVGSFSPSATTSLGLADVKLHSLSAPYGGGLGSRSRGGSVVSYDGGSSRGAGEWHTVGSRGKSRAESLAAAAAAHEDLECFFTTVPPPPPPRAFTGFAHSGPGWDDDDGIDVLGKRGLPLKRDNIF